MKKVIVFITISLILLSGFQVFATIEKEIRFKNDNIIFDSIIINENDEYSSILLDGTNSMLLRPNSPMLPSFEKTYKFPVGVKIKNVKCSVSNIVHQKISNRIECAPQPLPLNTELIKKVNIENFNYNSKTTFPGNWYEYNVGRGLDGKNRCIFVKIEVIPIQYIPIDNRVEIAKNIDIQIEYELDMMDFSNDEEWKLIIITPEEFINELQPLINHKNNRDISTKLVTLADIYNGVYFSVEGRDDQERIKYFIKNAYDQWDTIYVLFVGGDEEIPVRMTHVFISDNPPEPEEFVSDLYYADIYDSENNFSSWDTNNNDVFGEYKWYGFQNTDEVDIYPDVYIGRIACTENEDVSTCVNKIINYESNEAYKQDWFFNVIGIGGDTFVPDDGDTSGILEGELVNQYVFDLMDGFIPNKLWVSNSKLIKASPTGVENINDAINEGSGFIDFSGHGNTNVYATHKHNSSHSIWVPTPYGRYSSFNIESLENGDKLPIVITGACSVGKFNRDKNCFSWSFIKNPNGGGIASFGATALGYACFGESAPYCSIEKLAISTFEAYKNHGAITVGEMWGKGINNFMPGSPDKYDYKTLEEWQLFGDPSLAIAEDSQSPLKPDILDGPSSGATGNEYTFTASTTDPDGDDLFYLFDWGDDDFSSWIGPINSGQNVEAKHTWDNEGDYQIRVIAKDWHGVQSEWSDPLPISIPKKKLTIPFFTFIGELLERFQVLNEIIGQIFLQI